MTFLSKRATVRALGFILCATATAVTFDIPIIVRAQKLIKRYEAIRKREAKTLAR